MFEEFVTAPTEEKEERISTQYEISQLRTEEAKQGLEILKQVSLLSAGFITRLP